MKQDEFNPEPGQPEDVQEADFYVALGRRIKEIRLARGYRTATAFAEVLGVNEDTASAWETASWSRKRRPSAWHLWRIREITGFPVDYILGGDRSILNRELYNLLPPEKE